MTKINIKKLKEELKTGKGMREQSGKVGARERRGGETGVADVTVFSFTVFFFFF